MTPPLAPCLPTRGSLRLLAVFPRTRSSLHLIRSPPPIGMEDDFCERVAAFQHLMNLKEDARSAIESYREAREKKEELISEYRDAKNRMFARWNSLQSELGSDPTEDQTQRSRVERERRPEEIEDDVEMRSHKGKRNETDKWNELKVVLRSQSDSTGEASRRRQPIGMDPSGYGRESFRRSRSKNSRVGGISQATGSEPFRAPKCQILSAISLGQVDHVLRIERGFAPFER